MSLVTMGVTQSHCCFLLRFHERHYVRHRVRVDPGMLFSSAAIRQFTFHPPETIPESIIHDAYDVFLVRKYTLHIDA